MFPSATWYCISVIMRHNAMPLTNHLHHRLPNGKGIWLYCWHMIASMFDVMSSLIRFPLCWNSPFPWEQWWGYSCAICEPLLHLHMHTGPYALPQDLNGNKTALYQLPGLLLKDIVITPDGQHLLLIARVRRSSNSSGPQQELQMHIVGMFRSQIIWIIAAVLTLPLGFNEVYRMAEKCIEQCVSWLNVLNLTQRSYGKTAKYLK